MHAELTELYLERKDKIIQRLKEFRSVSPDEYFFEMVYCLLTPQTSARNAEKAVNSLKQHRYHELDIDPLPHLHSNDHYIRFHHTKAKRLNTLKKVMTHVTGILTDEIISAFEKRELLVSLVNGFGLKEATHFLRNIGKNDGLAILDRHILRNLKKFGVIDTVPGNLSPKRYYELEKQFQKFAAAIQIPLDELDLLLWSMETGVILK